MIYYYNFIMNANTNDTNNMNDTNHISKSPLEYQRIKSFRNLNYKRTSELVVPNDTAEPRLRPKSGTPRYGMKTTRSTYRTDRDISKTLKYR